MDVIENIPKITLLLIFLFILLYIIDPIIFENKLWDLGTGKSFDQMDSSEWYRIFTGTFFHHSLLHLIANCLALYFVGSLIEPKIGSFSFLIIYLIGNIGASLITAIFSSFTDGNGASPGIFALIACLIFILYKQQSLQYVKFGNWTVNYTVLYLIFSNFIGLSAFIVHILGFGIGILSSILLIYINY